MIEPLPRERLCWQLLSRIVSAKLVSMLAYMRHPAGRAIASHVHNPMPREVHFTQEVLFIKRGRLRVDFFDEARRYLESRVP